MDIWGSAGFDPNTPNVARLYDYYLGGKDHFPADRLAAEEILRVAPEVRAAARANRAFLGRAVRYLADRGIRQFLDIGAGLPSWGNVHEIAGSGSRVAYVDNDPVVLVHGRAMLARDNDITVIPGDLREPHQILKNRHLGIDFSEPVGVLLVAVMHYVAEADDPARIMTALREALPPGSFLVMSHGTSDARRAAVAKAGEVYSSASASITLRSRTEIEALFTGFDLVPPGLVWLPEWQPDQTSGLDFPESAADALLLCGVGRLGAT
ncbi:SAM-dependent methyltransferase [Nonomuraea longicatena]|uniref:SAM-dependent methyltransferase n=1 Tax=Nonomuraea longicatena TaxID=83682 RepID=A0ABP4AYV9_9ACTN